MATGVLSHGTMGTEDFAVRLAGILHARGVTQADLARHIGVTQSAVGQWRAGRKTPFPATVFLLERVLEVAPGELSSTLGYFPVDAPDVLTARQWVTTSDLAPEHQQVVVAMVEALLKTQARDGI